MDVLVGGRPLENVLIFSQTSRVQNNVSLPDRQHGRLEGVALMHLLVNLPPCVALSNCQDVVLWRGKTAPDVLTIEPLVPALQVLPGDVELAELRKREDAHQKIVAEHRVHPLELVASFGLAPLFHLILPVPAINRALLSGLPWPFSWLRECAYQVFMGMKPIPPPVTGASPAGRFLEAPAWVW